MFYACNLKFQVVGNVVPAAAVTPQPLVYTIIVAVKRLVVGLNTAHNTVNKSECTKQAMPKGVVL